MSEMKFSYKLLHDILNNNVQVSNEKFVNQQAQNILCMTAKQINM